MRRYRAPREQFATLTPSLVRNKRRSQSARANCRLRVRLSLCWHNQAGLPRRDRPVDVSAMLALFRHRRKPASLVLAIVKNEQPCPIHPERVAPRFCGAGAWNVKCKALLRASRMGGRGYLAKSSAQKSAGLSEFFESTQLDALTFQGSYRQLPFS